MGTYLFANSASGNYTQHRVDTALHFLHAAAMPANLMMVRTPQDVQACCLNIIASDVCPLIIVAAGDGTFNAVLNALPPQSATLAVLPLGTSNVLAAELGIRSLHDALKRIVSGNRWSLSIGRLDLAGNSLRFALMAGMGVDGAVVRGVRETEKRVLKQGAYLLSALRVCAAWESDSIDVITDSGCITCHTAIVCNAARYGGNHILAPSTNIFSTGFEVVCILKGKRTSYLGAGLDLLTGHAASSRHLRHILCHEIELRSYKPIQIDGDFVGHGPARLTAISDAFQIIV